jgi:hypothetical protein
MDMFLILSTYINGVTHGKTSINVIFASMHLDVVMAICHVPSTMSLQRDHITLYGHLVEHPLFKVFQTF